MEVDAGQLSQWDDEDSEAFESGNPQDVLIATTRAQRCRRMRNSFEGDHDAPELIAMLERNQLIYNASVTLRRVNNTNRIALICEYFIKNCFAAKAQRCEAKRIRLKIGAVHAGAAR